MQAFDPRQRLLDAIAGSESPGYNTMYGGQQFSSFADHPRVAVPITSGPNAGKTSSAAGRYQFLGSTWDQEKNELGLPDFSPQSQDAAAWHLASKTYKAKTGRELEQDVTAAQQDPSLAPGISSALSGVWTSLPGGIEPNGASNGFAARLTGQAPAATPASYQGGGSLAGPRTAMPAAPKRGAGLPGITEPDGFIAGGPGAWLGMPNGVTAGGYDVGGAMQGVGTSLMSIDNPKGAAALASMQSKNDQGKFTVQRDPNTGTLFRIDNKTGRVDVVKDPAFQKPNPYGDAFAKEDAQAQVKRRQGIFDAANGAREKIGTLDEMGRILSKPELYQGSGGEYVQQAKKIGASVFGMDFSGIADGDVVQALGNKFALELRDPKSGAGMPGALSDSDREFLRSMVPGVKLSQEANMRLIDIYKKVEQRKLDEADLAHQYSKSKGGMFDSEFDTWRDQQLKARQQAQQQQQQQAPANRPPLQSIFGR